MIPKTSCYQITLLHFNFLVIIPFQKLKLQKAEIFIAIVHSSWFVWKISQRFPTWPNEYFELSCQMQDSPTTSLCHLSMLVFGVDNGGQRHPSWIYKYTEQHGIPNTNINTHCPSFLICVEMPPMIQRYKRGPTY